eukprot:TRINITY_DN6831_c0_g1_i2.p1 TRINITY_DN6831_c0_g1~~TRINITY_DN6831_c0_g1_i2.p1  ORF type:complete len:799 (+),score=206.74 TRINITY_DN6831_c0_g1_i2:290-2686(+)
MSDLASLLSSDESPPSLPTSQNEDSPPPAASESSLPPTSSASPSSESTKPNSPSPKSSADAPQPADDSSSSSPPPSNSDTPPPSDLNSPPPPSNLKSPPPPSDLKSPPPAHSNSPPPSHSGSSPPSPPSDANSSPPSSSPSDANSSLPSPPSDSSPPPPKSDSPPEGPDQPAPPPDESSTSGNSPPPVSPHVQTPPSPPADSPSVQTVAPPNSKTPSSKPSSSPETPPNEHTPPTQSKRGSPSQPAPPTSQISNRTPRLSPPSTKSDSGSSKHSSSNILSDSSKDSGQGVVVGVTLAGVAIIALVAIVFMILRRKKRRAGTYMDNHRPPNSFSGKSDGYYHGQPTGGNSAHLDPYSGMKVPVSYSGGSSYGSNRGNGFNSGTDQNAMGNSKSWFTYEELMNITDGFSQQNILGEGGFGCVYKGQLPDGRVVAVKQLKAGSGQGEREFRAEVEIISRVHHRHLVSLVGYCIAEHHRLLVYEFVPNDTLEHHLHGKAETFIDWPKRVKIAIGAAKGLAYLHEDCHPRIIHRDIKSANILLDNSFEAQVADFGLAKLTNDAHTHVSTRVMGTFGYLAPEYASSGKLTDRSDVFSFGVVLLELVTGRKPVDTSQPLGEESLVEWARPLLIQALETGEFEELVDPRLENNFKTSEMFRMIEVAAACVRHSSSKRPRMVQVVRALDSEGAIQDLTNGVKLGESTVFEAGQCSVDVRRLQRMAFGSDDYSSDYNPSGEYDQRSTTYSAELRSREAPQRQPNPWKGSEPTLSEYPSSSESETRAMYPRGSGRSSDGLHSNYGYNRR